MRRLLFVLCRRVYNAGYESYGYPWGRNSGLYNSALFVIDMLNASGISASIVEVQDQNAIDAAVAKAKPSDVVIEAIWVQPSKMAQLAKLHPRVRWWVRNHSELPFLAGEGSALATILGYMPLSAVFVASNTPRGVADLRVAVAAGEPHWTAADVAARVLYLPNYYPLPSALERVPPTHGVLNVGAFGSLRILKNQLLEAIAAIDLARQMGVQLRFHVNAARHEFLGENVLRNLRAVFAAAAPNAVLVEHPWLDRPAFLQLCARMDLGLQVSFSETFNFVAADMVTENTPVVASPEVFWLDRRFWADPNSRADIVAKSILALGYPDKMLNRSALQRFDAAARAAWLAIFGTAPAAWVADGAQWRAQPVIVEHR
jgi:hypothetical protein